MSRHRLPIAHALATLDVRLAALAAGLAVDTERELPYDGGRLRPDNLVTLPDGTLALFETEQLTRPAYVRRIVAGLRNKLAFFRSQAGKGLSPTVRLLFYLKRNRDWDRSLLIWEQATATVAQQAGGSLPFHLLALPLPEFLEQPDWAEPPADLRWENLFDPARLPSFGPSPTDKPTSARGRKPTLPPALKRRSARDDRLVLQALWQVFREQAAADPALFPRPAPAFFEVMELIHAATHAPDAPPLAQAAKPHPALYLLREYLRMHPRLRQALSKAMTRGSSSMRWTNTVILHRMQVVIHTFLDYHGWRCDGPLLAFARPADWHDQAPQTFGVTVRIASPELLMRDGDGVVPGRDEVRRVERALAWVLWALFAYSTEVGLKRAPFW